MENKVPARIANTLINSLKGGVVPRIGLEYITVGRAQEITAILRDIDMVAEGGASFRFIVGKYGSGKSFLLQTIRNYAAARGFAVADADLSPERRFAGTKGQGLATYKELMQSLSTKSKPDGGALPLILERWISGIQTSVKSDGGLSGDDFDREVERRIFVVAGSLEGMVNGFEFAKAVVAYWKAYKQGDSETISNVLRWFRGEYPTRREAKADLGINFIVTDETWYDFLKIFAVFLVSAGYKGLLVLIDELVNIYKIPNSITRQNNYEKLLTIYNDAMQGKAKHIGFLMGGTPQCIEDKYRGVYSYEALRSRLAEGHFAADDLRDLTAPIIKLQMLTQEEMYVLVEKLRDIHAGLFGYSPTFTHEDLIYFLTVEYNRVGADSHITPREIIRDFIELIGIVHQNPGKNAADILGSNSFELARGGLSEEDIHAEFREFEI
ncbi:MAG: ATP-binding protein [Oscillospiraceae bacterium]|jgi:energy-coupling factor transporter ATP-binding protein EcfA2|nr:ATP-binding protein [Oscillospiraceae bacterium]